jgi:hypothetical protein
MSLSYGTTQGAVSHDFWVCIFPCMIFFLHCISVLIYLLLHILFCSYIFSCPKRATTRRTHLRSSTALLRRSWMTQFPMLSFRWTMRTTRKSWARKINKKLGSSAIYLTKEQYSQVKISKYFHIQYLILVVTWRTGSIFVQLVIPWFRKRMQDYLEFCKLWSSSSFKVKSEKKRLNRGKDLKHGYGTDGHVRRL